MVWKPSVFGRVATQRPGTCCRAGDESALDANDTAGMPGARGMSESGAAEPHTLVLRAYNGGFFSHVNCVVNHLHHTLGRDGCVAVRVDWRAADGPPNFIYGGPEDGELWQRFFEPLAFATTPAAERTARHYADRSMTGLHAYRMYRYGTAWRRRYGAAFARYVLIQERLRRRGDELWQGSGASEHSVGVHYRHPDHSIECPRDIPPIDVFVERTRRLLRGHSRASVVLATDVHEAVDRFRSVFGERVVVQPDVLRVSLGDRQNVRAAAASVALGEQALIDALLLMRCGTLLHTTSNLATAVGYMSPGVRMVYCEPRLRTAVETVRVRLSPRRPATDEGITRRSGVAGRAHPTGR